MRNLFKKIAAVSVAASLLMTGGIMAPVSAEEIGPGTDVTVSSGSVNEQGMYGLYDHIYWNDDQGSIETKFKLRGAFDFTFNDVSSAICMTGNLFVRQAKDAENNDITVREKLYGDPVIEYRAKVETDDNYRLGAYGWFDKDRIEYFIVDDWGGFEPSECSGELVGTIEADGGIYDIYKNYVGGFDNPTPVTQITSVRREKKSTENGYVDGKISVYKHFEEWKKLGIATDEPYDIMFAADAFNATGTIHVLMNDLYYLYNSELDDTEPVGTGPDWNPGEGDEFPDTLHDTVFTTDVTDERDGYFFRLLPNSVFNGSPDNGTCRLELGEGGKFKCSWDNDRSANFERGLEYYNSENVTRSVVRKYNGEELTIDYEADFAPEGSAIAGAHGWLNCIGVEYFVVEAWKDWEVPEGAEPLGTVSLNDGIYELYKGPDNPWYTTVYSVRRDNKLGEDSHIEGTINISSHLYAWEKYGISPVDPDYVNFAVISYNGSGSADVTKNIVKIDGVDIYQETVNEPDTPEAPTEAPTPAAPVSETPTGDEPATSPNQGFAGSGAVPAYIPGDINHDNQVDGFDVIFGRRELVKSINGENAVSESDVDLSGDTRINDLILITKIAMGADVKLPTKRSGR